MTDTPPAHPALLAASQPTPPHLAGSLVALKRAVDKHWPGRDKRSDGFLGDERHQAKGAASDHNPWLNNTIRAGDFTVTQGGVHGIDGPWFAESLRLLGYHGDPRLAGRSGDVNDNGYVIHAGHITAPDFSRWVPYHGENPHTVEVHVSVTRDPAGYEDTRPWSFLEVAPAHPAGPVPVRHVEPVRPAPAGHQVDVIGPHAGNTAAEAPAPVLDLAGPEPGYAPAGHDAVGDGPHFRAQYGNEGPRIKHLQSELNRDLPLYSALEEDGVYGAETAAVIQDFARRAAADPACPTDHRAALAAANGDNVGPHLAAVFPVYGINV